MSSFKVCFWHAFAYFPPLEDYAMSRAESGIHELLEQEPGTARRILADGSC